MIPIDLGFGWGDGEAGEGEGSIQGGSGGYSGSIDFDKLEGITPMIQFCEGKTCKTVEAQLVRYPPGSKGPPNAIGGVAPEWQAAGNAKISVSMNGEDFEGNFDYKFTEKITASAISPRAGPVTGDTPV